LIDCLLIILFVVSRKKIQIIREGVRGGEREENFLCALAICMFLADFEIADCLCACVFFLSIIKKADSVGCVGRGGDGGDRAHQTSKIYGNCKYRYFISKR
jgi:hypothetical protein